MFLLTEIRLIRKLLRVWFPDFHPTRIAIVRKGILFLTSVIRPRVLKTKHGFRLFIPKSDRSIYTLSLFLTKEYEPKESELILSLLKKGDTVIDIGANVGYMTCLMGQRVGTIGTVYAFEPEPRNFEILHRNIKLNNLSNVKAYNLALSEKCGVSRLFISPENKGDHTLVFLNNGRGFVNVKTVRIDGFISERDISLVKIDVQGYELHVLNGMTSYLSNRVVRNIIVEFTPFRVKKSGKTPYEFFEIIQRYGLNAVIITSTIGNQIMSIEKVRRNMERYTSNEYASFNVHLRFDKKRERL